MNINITCINRISDYRECSVPTLYVTSVREVPDFLRSKGEAVCIHINDESKLSDFDSYKYFTTGDVQYSGHLNMVYCHIKNIPFVIAQDDSILIREECPEDLDKIYEMYEDPECRRFLEPLPPSDSVLTPESRFESVKNGYMLFGYGMWIVEEKSTGEVIGRAGFEYQDENTVSLGFMIRSDKRKKGYARNACLLCLNYLKDSLPDMKVTAKCSQANEASLKVLSGLSGILPIEILII